MHQDARRQLYRAPGGALGAMALLWGYVQKLPREQALCSCGSRLAPLSLHPFEDEITADGVAMPFRLVTAVHPCESCGLRHLWREKEARWIFEDLAVRCDFPAGSRHVGIEREAEARRAEIWQVTPAEFAAIAPPHQGRHAPRRRRFYRPARGKSECYECGGDGACVTCEGAAPRDCIDCQGTGRCILCRGAGELSAT